MTAELRRTLESRLRDLSPSRLKITDESRAHRGHPEAKNGAHFRLEIVSSKFTGISAIARHRMVFAAIGDLASAGVHALSVKAFAPNEIIPQQQEQPQ